MGRGKAAGARVKRTAKKITRRATGVKHAAGAKHAHKAKHLRSHIRIGSSKLRPRAGVGKKRGQIQVSVGAASCGISAGALAVIAEFEKRGVKPKRVGCIGMCHAEPIVEVKYGDGETLVFAHANPADARKIAHGFGFLEKGKFIAKRKGGKKVIGGHYLDELPFFKLQERRLTWRCGRVSPDSLDDYLAHRGFTALRKALKMKPERIVAEVKDSKLRGRGGAAFPTGLKWEFMRKSPEKERYLICNADEGDPGVFSNRILFESDPFAVIEGMVIAGYALEATKGFIYIRAEYGKSITHLKHALALARENNFLGRKILGSKFSFDIEIREGAGAYVCGEETALTRSIEGLSGRPVPRPPFPTEKGLWGKPTVIQNTETLTNIPYIVLNGSAWFGEKGVSHCPGTKIFSISGDIAHTGYVEVPLGVKLGHLLELLGIKTHELKAVHLGGPSGGCLPIALHNTTLDYDSLCNVGATVGSGSIIFLGKKRSIPEFAHKYVGFFVSESCGKCVPCREGTMRLLETLDRVLAGGGKISDLKELDDLSGSMKDSALCGLGQAAPNALQSTLKYFREEYLAHISGMPSVESPFSEFIISKPLCNGCDLCVRVCPTDAITGRKGELHAIIREKCIWCGHCVEACPVKAIHLERVKV
ncbi:MAG: NADH-ubiquinone oxidoreductase-F iron-sulfur binding region domain-containing protein [Candidatus Diapherotrites archaeon]